MNPTKWKTAGDVSGAPPAAALRRATSSTGPLGGLSCLPATHQASPWNEFLKGGMSAKDKTWWLMILWHFLQLHREILIWSDTHSRRGFVCLAWNIMLVYFPCSQKGRNRKDCVSNTKCFIVMPHTQGEEQEIFVLTSRSYPAMTTSTITTPASYLWLSSSSSSSYLPASFLFILLLLLLKDSFHPEADPSNRGCDHSHFKHHGVLSIR